jgi:hypothetical protein
MAWIESHQELREHKKTYRLMAELGINKREALGIVHLLWWWCVDNAITGRIEVPELAIARATEWESDARQLVQALVKAGWLEVHAEGGWTVHDWHHHCGSLIERRLERREFKERRADAKRKPNGRRSVDKKPPTVSVPDPTVSLPNNTLAAPAASAPPPPESPKPENDVQRVVKAWKMMTGIPTEGEASAAWDKVHFPRHAKSASALIELFGSRTEAIYCMEHVYAEMTKKKLTCTIETCVKHSDLYRETLQRRVV